MEHCDYNCKITDNSNLEYSLAIENYFQNSIGTSNANQIINKELIDVPDLDLELCFSKINTEDSNFKEVDNITSNELKCIEDTINEIIKEKSEGIVSNSSSQFLFLRQCEGDTLNTSSLDIQNTILEDTHESNTAIQIDSQCEGDTNTLSTSRDTYLRNVQNTSTLRDTHVSNTAIQITGIQNTSIQDTICIPNTTIDENSDVKNTIPSIINIQNTNIPNTTVEIQDTSLQIVCVKDTIENFESPLVENKIKTEATSSDLKACLECTFCKEYFENKAQFTNHAYEIHNSSSVNFYLRNIMKCKYCDLKFTILDSKYTHKCKTDICNDNEVEIYSYKCSNATCVYVFYTREHCEKHIKEMHSSGKNNNNEYVKSELNKLLQCENCFKLIRTEVYLNIHKKEICGRSLIPCNICQIWFKKSHEYDEHMVNTHYVGLPTNTITFTSNNISYNLTPVISYCDSTVNYSDEALFIPSGQLEFSSETNEGQFESCYANISGNLLVSESELCNNVMVDDYGNIISSKNIEMYEESGISDKTEVVSYDSPLVNPISSDSNVLTDSSQNSSYLSNVSANESYAILASNTVGSNLCENDIEIVNTENQSITECNVTNLNENVMQISTDKNILFENEANFVVKNSDLCENTGYVTNNIASSAIENIVQINVIENVSYVPTTNIVITSSESSKKEHQSYCTLTANTNVVVSDTILGTEKVESTSINDKNKYENSMQLDSVEHTSNAETMVPNLCPENQDFSNLTSNLSIETSDMQIEHSSTDKREEQIESSENVTITNDSGMNIIVRDFQAKFLCSSCNEIYKNRYECVKHITLAHETRSVNLYIKKIMKCNHCKLIFQDSDVYQNHICRKNHDDNIVIIFVYHCSVRKCDEVFNVKEDCENHVREKHDKSSEVKTKLVTMYHCDRCFKLFLSENTYSCHALFLCGKAPLFCGICEAVFSTEKELEMHIQRLHFDMLAEKNGSAANETNIKTNELVNNEIKNVINDTTNKRTHGVAFKEPISEKDENSWLKACFLCSLCKKSFEEREIFIEHSKKVHNSVDFYLKNLLQCKKCKLKFDVSDAKLVHVCEINSKKSKSEIINVEICNFNCPIKSCKWNFINKELCIKHIKNKHGNITKKLQPKLSTDIMSQCNHCFKLLRPGNLKGHRSKCSNIPLNCAVCHIMFKKKCDLDIHIEKFHSGNQNTEENNEILEISNTEFSSKDTEVEEGVNISDSIEEGGNVLQEINNTSVVDENCYSNNDSSKSTEQTEVNNENNNSENDIFMKEQLQLAFNNNEQPLVQEELNDTGHSINNSFVDELGSKQNSFSIHINNEEAENVEQSTLFVHEQPQVLSNESCFNKPLVTEEIKMNTEAVQSTTDNSCLINEQPLLDSNESYFQNNDRSVVVQDTEAIQSALYDNEQPTLFDNPSCFPNNTSIINTETDVNIEVFHSSLYENEQPQPNQNCFNNNHFTEQPKIEDVIMNSFEQQQSGTPNYYNNTPVISEQINCSNDVNSLINNAIEMEQSHLQLHPHDFSNLNECSMITTNNYEPQSISNNYPNVQISNNYSQNNGNFSEQDCNISFENSLSDASILAETCGFSQQNETHFDERYFPNDNATCNEQYEVINTILTSCSGLDNISEDNYMSSTGPELCDSDTLDNNLKTINFNHF